MIAVIDYGMGNLRSVTNALGKLGAEVTVTNDRAAIESAQAIVLPGVGAFGRCIENLEEFGLLGFLKETILSGKRYLGICLGMQVLFESSEEAPGISGMGIFKGTVPRFSVGMKIPHMGWNSIKRQKDSEMLNGIEVDEHFYFVHSYYCAPDENSVIATTTSYGQDFASSVERDRIFACQFHPEKSQKAGLKLLQNFISLSSKNS
ncbi:MAG TPA: imidazole glycerol phosphate synthase subunit HisH [Syntrophorhabdaceae bacterium]|nr:imidazole glycerol phosphate synthase subunit HisH [Syntrophorhabdaceae bacterium]